MVFVKWWEMLPLISSCLNQLDTLSTSSRVSMFSSGSTRLTKSPARPPLSICFDKETLFSQMKERLWLRPGMEIEISNTLSKFSTHSTPGQGRCISHMQPWNPLSILPRILLHSNFTFTTSTTLPTNCTTLSAIPRLPTTTTTMIAWYLDDQNNKSCNHLHKNYHYPHGLTTLTTTTNNNSLRMVGKENISCKWYLLRSRFVKALSCRCEREPNCLCHSIGHKREFVLFLCDFLFPFPLNIYFRFSLSFWMCHASL